MKRLEVPVGIGDLESFLRYDARRLVMAGHNGGTSADRQRAFGHQTAQNGFWQPRAEYLWFGHSSARKDQPRNPYIHTSTT